MRFDFLRCIAFVAMGLGVPPVQAGIVLNTTRVIYQGADKEASLGVQNSGSGEILLQSWLEAPDAATPDTAQKKTGLPFIVTPALARMSGGGRQLLRIIHSGTGLPADRESVLWLNVQEIPQTAAENTLQIAIRQRIKVFFRPQGLEGDALQAPEKLRWTWGGGDVLNVENPGPYHVSMLRVSARQSGTERVSLDRQMLAPHQRLSLPLLRKGNAGPLELSFLSINDFGGQVPYQARLNEGVAVYASKASTR
ncbi:molecular chaperone [Pseudomonas viridiflava]|uniref:Pili assembly chaperone: pili assembly chaperone n=1 Tax=Pseudomonas viridiflava TaxID=33069 RepID=A0A3M5P757_PSEVI|nr:molecular chaperone [Pseudomonas viridiflava]MBA1229523.1 molecular chaperone [Pseudomonas viridiflava]RMT80590.1 Pili assembly chaperone: pili assembly chaperone [Pseudomonas viridiflava]